MTTTAPRIRDLLVAAVVMLGLVGMHHLVVAACHHATAQAILAPASVVPPVSVDHGHGAPEPSVPSELAAVCIAILFITGVVLLGTRSVVTRVRLERFVAHSIAWFERALPPPDLAVLSISRT